MSALREHFKSTPMQCADSRSLPKETAPTPVDLLVVIPHMGPGGAQRVASLLINHWSGQGIRVAVATLHEKADAHDLSPAVARFHISGPQALRHKGRLTALTRDGDSSDQLTAKQRISRSSRRLAAGIALRTLLALNRARKLLIARLLAPIGMSPTPLMTHQLRRLFRDLEPPLIISFLGTTNIQTVMAARGLRSKVVISERNDPAIQALDEPWEGLRRVIYPKAALVTANSAGALHTLGSFVPAKKLRQVANPLVIPPPPAGMVPHQSRLIAVARLVHQKGLDILLDAFAELARADEDWMLDIVGAGPLGSDLQAQALRLGISSRVEFHGHQPSPFPLLYRASVFVLPSRFEGMPNAMLEAMGCGLAVVASDASPGPLEFIENNVSGLVVPSEDRSALAQALMRITRNTSLRRRLAQSARARVANLDVATVAKDWETHIQSLGIDFGLVSPGFETAP
jgi:glycosyltransferase involved in cell wall biosynthesis